ncbi:MAG: thioesterase family protein [Flavobacteriaceae bacterium]
MNAQVFEKKIRVPSSAIDAQNHVNNLSYLQWCVDAAEAHWKNNTSQKVREKYIWYVLHHSIDYKNPAFENEELQIQTWVTAAEGVKSEREYRITRINDGKVLIEAKTLWCLLDAKTLKPTKITDEIRTLFQ